MSYLSDDVLRALDDARTAVARHARKLCVHLRGEIYPVGRLWSGGFAIAADDAPRLCGTVDLFDGPRHLSTGQIIASQQNGAEWIYEFKWNTSVLTAPALDYIRDDETPAAQLTQPR